MEEKKFPFSLDICRFIVENTLVGQVSNNLPPSRSELKLYSSKKSEHMTNMIINSTKHTYDSYPNRLSEDTQIINKNQSAIDANHSKISTKVTTNHEKKDSIQTQSIFQRPSWSSSGLGLVPLTHLQIESDQETEEEDIQTRMRDVKIHQENVRTRIMQNFKSGKPKKTVLQYKGQGKTIPKMGVYDYDGSLIQPFKSQGIRYPGHYQDIEVQIQNKEQKASLLKVNKKKGGKNVRFQCLTKNKEELKPTESIFLKQLNKIQWVDGVEIISGKEQCRKILGYHQAVNLRKKRIDFSKPSEASKHIKLDDLQNCRNYFRRESCLGGYSSQTHLRLSQNFLKKEDLDQLEGPRTIKVANNKALQFLMNQVSEEAFIPTKKSVFSESKKVLKSFHN